MHGTSRKQRTQYAPTAQPYVRWWWFAEAISTDDIDAQLDWIRDNGFGGVEIAWVYPYDVDPRSAADASGRPVAEWLGPEWRRLVVHAAKGCAARGLGCDFTLGTLWPFGGSQVELADASMTFAGPSKQRLQDTWESAHGRAESLIVNHLDGEAVKRYAAPIVEALRPALSADCRRPSALFSDSWEVEPEGLWTSGFGDGFEADYGYRIEPFMDRLSDCPDAAYDYFRYRGRLVLSAFYETLAAICTEAGALSRVQCHGAPTDLIAAYAAADVPESEALLFDPPFSAIAASAAAQAGRPVISAEAFTCLYGWAPRPGPGPMIGEERAEDLKLVADALFASGVNHLVWHGMPFSPAGQERRFYATTHVGPDASFAAELPGLNAYFARTAADLRAGGTLSQIAVYLPLEDAVAGGALPSDHLRPSAAYHWELQYLRFPGTLWGYRPIWTSEAFLAGAVVEDGVIRLGSASVKALYVDVDRLSIEVVESLHSIAAAGGTVFMRRSPVQAGRKRRRSFATVVRALLAFETVRDPRFLSDIPPLVAAGGGERPPFWAVRDGDVARFFFAHPDCGSLSYPLDASKRYGDRTVALSLSLPAFPGAPSLDVRFDPRSSVTVEVSARGGTAANLEREQPGL